METINLKQIKSKYGMGDNFWRTNLCRAEFSKHLKEGKSEFHNTKALHDDILNLLFKKSMNNHSRFQVLNNSTLGG